MRFRISSRARVRSHAGFAALLPMGMLVPAVVISTVISVPHAGAFTAPASVKDVSANAATNPGTAPLFGGRVEAFSVNPVNPQIVLAATEYGGVWRTVDGGAHWSHVDGLPLTHSDDVKFAKSDPSLVLATGEYDGSSTTHTAVIYRSTDGGTTWSLASATSCGGNARSAHKIGFGSGTPGSLLVVVATDCGLVKSTNSGTTWTDVFPDGVSDQFWDVKILGGGASATIDTCDASGSFFRSTNGGATWTQTVGALKTGSLPCRTATAPRNANVVFLSSFSKTKAGNGLCKGQLFESDNGGASFTNLKATSDGNCRPANVITSPGFTGTTPTHFELFFATDTNWIHEHCNLHNLATSKTACPIGNGNNGGTFSDYDGSIKAVHNGPDSSDLAFGANGCPFLSGGDGGVFSTTNGCATSPTFTQANVGLHALQATGEAGSSYSGHSDLYFSTQDNGIWWTDNGGSSWGEIGPDVYGVFADQNGPPSQVLYKECCFVSTTIISSHLKTNNGTMSSEGTLSLPPPHSFPPFGNILGAQFGYQRYALMTFSTLTTATKPGTVTQPSKGIWRVYVTTNNGSTWAQMGPKLPDNSRPKQLLFSGTPTSPSFYLLNQVGGTAPTVSRLSGPLNSSATFTPAGGGLANPTLIAVDPSNSLLLYAVDNGGGGQLPAVKRSVDGGAVFGTDSALTNLITAGGKYQLPGSVTAIGMDPNSSTILVGTVDDGIFASTSGGSAWSQLRGSVQISRAQGFFFDEKTGKAYASSAGRGEWEIDLPQADLAITKTHFPDPVIAGNQLTWELSVSNNGPDAAPDVVVTDTLPAQDTYLTNNLNPPASCTASGQTVTCDLGDLANGQTVTFSIVTLVLPTTVANAGGPTNLTNSATVSSAAVIDPNSSNNTAEDTAVVNDSADLAVAKICKPDTTIYEGQSIKCSVFVNNSGPSWARNVVMDDTTLSNGAFTITGVVVNPGPTVCTVNTVIGGQLLSCSLGNLANESTTQTGQVVISYTVTGTSTSSTGQNVDNTASVRTDTPDPNPTNNSATVSLTVTALADLALTMHGPSSVVAGTPITWTLHATNNGPSDAANVVVTDTVPAGVVINSVFMPGATCTTGVAGDPTQPAVCSLGTLTHGSTSAAMTIHATVDPQTTGTLQNNARVSSATYDPNLSNNLASATTSVIVMSSIAVSITAAPNPVTAGTPLSYQLTVSNGGPSTARGVTLTDPLPAALTFTSVTSTGSCGFQTNTNTVTCSLPNLDPGQSEIVYIYTGVKSSALPPSVVDSASANAVGSAPGTNSVTTPVVTSADLAISLTTTSAVYKPSSTIHYTITVNNFGPSDAQDVVIVQALPAVKQGKYVSNNLGCPSPLGTTLTCSYTSVPALVTIPNGGSLSFQVNFYITGNKQTVTSKASISALTSDPSTTNNSSTSYVTVK
jgi:uncharacterized repeat protein (TIGR01451 family)